MDGPDTRAELDPRDPNYDSGDDGSPVEYSLQAAAHGPDTLPAFKQLVRPAPASFLCSACFGCKIQPRPARTATSIWVGCGLKLCRVARALAFSRISKSNYANHKVLSLFLPVGMNAKPIPRHTAVSGKLPMSVLHENPPPPPGPPSFTQHTPAHLARRY